MYVKRYPIQIWFLSTDLTESAKFLTDKLLNKSLTGCMTALIAARFYFIGIRSAKFYKYYFDKVRRSETMEHFFPLWPLKQPPPFNQYSSKTSKWCRQCKEHYDYIKTYMDVLLQEYEYRNKKPHGLEKFLEWLECDAPQMNIPQGNIKKIVVPWKVLNPKYRRKDIQLGYRLQYKALLENDGIKITDFKNRDIPEFLMQQNSQWLE